MTVGEQGHVGKSLNILNPYPVSMIRARIIVEGDVQRAGFRKNVWRAARKLGIKGLVENLKDGNVGVTCEAEKDTIDNFIEGIKVIPLVEIENISIVGTDKATGEFEYFEMIRGDMAEELSERLDTAVDVLYKTKNELKDEVKKVGDKIDCVGDKVESGNKMLAEKIDCVGDKVKSVGGNVKAMHDDMNLRFDGMVKKQDDTIGAIHDMHDDMNQRFDWMAETYGEFGKTLKSLDTKIDTMNASITEMKDSFVRFVDHVVDKTKGS